MDFIEDDYILDKNNIKLWNLNKLKTISSYLEDIYRMREEKYDFFVN